MKINDVLECINETLDAERKARNLNNSGHFIYWIGVEKKIGSTRVFTAYVDFINSRQVASHVIRYDYTCNCPTEKVEETKDAVSIQVLTQLLMVLRMGVGKGAYGNFLNGSFEGWT